MLLYIAQSTLRPGTPGYQEVATLLILQRLPAAARESGGDDPSNIRMLLTSTVSWLGAVALHATARTSVWPNSTDGVHTFLTFDSGVAIPSINRSSMRQVDFVWGSATSEGAQRIAAYAAATAARATGRVAVSTYIPYAWAPDASQSLEWWQREHPSWILYKCDRKTPAWYTGLENKNVPLDVTNPEVVRWQLVTYAAPAASAGYTVIAADMFELSNLFGACGVWERPGLWKPIYSAPPTPPAPAGPCRPTGGRSTGCPCFWNMSSTECACCDSSPPEHCCQMGKSQPHSCTKCTQAGSPDTSSDAHDNTRGALPIDFATAQIDWLAHFRQGLREFSPPMALIPNICLHGSGLRWDNPLLSKLRDSTDGVLDEAGWTGWGAARVPEPEWSNITMHALDLQEHGVGYYSINECGAVGSENDSDLRRWIVGSYLLSKNQAAAVYISGVQAYGWLLPDWSELGVPIGSPLSRAPYPVCPTGGSDCGVWQRQFSNGSVSVNAAASTTREVLLPPPKPSMCYYDVEGERVTASRIVLHPLTASILTVGAC